MTEYLELYGALEDIAAGDMSPESMVHRAKQAIGMEPPDEEDDDVEEECDCADRSWRGRKHDSACPLAGEDRLYVCPKCGREHEPTDMPNKCECGMVPK